MCYVKNKESVAINILNCIVLLWCYRNLPWCYMQHVESTLTVNIEDQTDNVSGKLVN